MIDAVDVPISGERILVTGGAGFIGSHLVEALAPDNEVVVLDDCSNGSREHVPDGVELVEGDVRSADAVARATEGVDVVFHLAGLVSVAESVERPAETEAINVGATVSLLERAREESARFVFASSAAVYGAPEAVPIAEDHPTEPTSPYGLSKLAAERFVRLYAELYDLPTVALRFFNVYGPRQAESGYSAVVAAFVERALAGEPLEIHGDGEQTRDFVHIRDVVQANLLAAAAGGDGAVYNVGTGSSVTISELAETVRSVSETDVAIEHTEARPGDISESRASIDRIRSELGYEPTVSLAEGLSELVAWKDGRLDGRSDT